MNDHWWKRKRRTDTWLNNFFTESDKIEKMMDNMISEAFETPTEREKARKHYTYQFGEHLSDTNDPYRSERYEPLIDVLEEETNIVITVDLPGIERNHIEIHATEDKATIAVDSPKLRYHKELNLPAKVDPKTSTATYKNGVLQIHLKKQIGQKLCIK